MEMSKRSVFALLLLCHLIGDYYLQDETMAQGKVAGDRKRRMKCYAQHCVCYAIPFALAAGSEFLVTGFNTSRAFGLCVVSHAVIDLIKICCMNERKFAADRDKRHEKERHGYLSDQAAHLLCLVAVAYLCPMPFPEVLGKWVELIPYLLYLASLLKPANVTFKVLFSGFQIKNQNEGESAAKSKSEEGTKSGAGAWIGNLERLLSGVLILLGQFSAVGLTMTAKSIARYDEIVKKPAFAEYYLIGTLYSILYTLVAYCVIFKFLV